MGLIAAILGTLSRPRGARTFEEGYASGYQHGIERALRALEGNESVGGYVGPVPEELTEWIAETRERMAV